jgi:AcrR family transcriptional regulator
VGLPRKTRTFKQQRSAATYEALLRAARRVFAKRGFDGAQTPEIAAAAGVSTGAFYRYFTDKRQAFLEMLADHLERGRREVEERLAPQRFVGTERRAAIEVVIDVLFEFMKNDAPLHRVVASMSLRDPAVAKLRAEFEATGGSTLATLIASVIPRSVVPNPEAAALVLQIAALEVAGERAGLRPGTGSRVQDDDVRRALGDLVERYLFPAARRRRG